MNCA
jgi:hypothetical protein